MQTFQLSYNCTVLPLGVKIQLVLIATFRIKICTSLKVSIVIIIGPSRTAHIKESAQTTDQMGNQVGIEGVIALRHLYVGRQQLKPVLQPKCRKWLTCKELHTGVCGLRVYNVGDVDYEAIESLGNVVSMSMNQIRQVAASVLISNLGNIYLYPSVKPCSIDVLRSEKKRYSYFGSSLYISITLFAHKNHLVLHIVGLNNICFPVFWISLDQGRLIPLFNDHGGKMVAFPSAPHCLHYAGSEPSSAAAWQP